MRVLVTGGAGLVGSECCRLLSENGYRVLSVDNYMRGRLLGEEANTKVTIQKLLKDCEIEHYELDIRDEKIIELVGKVDAVIHTAAQPSHPRSIEIPIEDFEINAWGTLFLLEAMRKHNRGATFIYCSTNKVYGDTPNYFRYDRVGKRLEPIDPCLRGGFDESLRTDRCLHTPFGISKLAGDHYTQEYGLLYGLKTGVFRMGCITGGSALSTEQHNWEPHFVRKALSGETLTIYGHEGYQVRDVIHARDLARLFLQFLEDPRPGEVYNVGGGRANSTSLLEAVDLIEKITSKKLRLQNGPAREGDHLWWITNMRKVRGDYPKWDVSTSLTGIFTEIFETLIE